MNKRLSLAGVILVLVAGYFWIVPAVKDYLAAREIANIERLTKIAEAKVELSIKTAESNGESRCSTDSIKLISDTKSDTDGGTKPNTSATAKISAAPGTFIYGATVVYNAKGTTKKEKVKYNYESLESSKGSSFERTLLKSASYTSWCSHENIFGTSNCTATATISGKQYANDCKKFIMDSEMNKVTGK